MLVGIDPQPIVQEADAILDGKTRSGAIPDKWDGHAAERIVDVLLNQPAQAGYLVCGMTVSTGSPYTWRPKTTKTNQH